MRTLIANLGDRSPFDHGGYFIFRDDETGEYEAELLEVTEGEYDYDADEQTDTYVVYRFRLDRCTYIGDVLSDNPFHPDHAAWFAKPESERANRPQDTTYLDDVARQYDDVDLIACFCSEDPLERAFAWRAVGEYHGFENLDAYPLTDLTRVELEARYEGYDKL